MKMNIVVVKLPAEGKVPVDASVVADPVTAAFGLGDGEGFGVGETTGPPTAFGEGLGEGLGLPLGEGEGELFAWAKG